MELKENYKIYMHKNKINGKIYIGQTKRSLKERFGKDGSYYKGCPIFYKAIQKYGWDNFDHILLFENINNNEMADRYEIYLIYLYNTTDAQYGYNVTKGGTNNVSYNLLKQVFQYDKNGLFLKSYKSISHAEKNYRCYRLFYIFMLPG